MHAVSLRSLTKRVVGGTQASDSDYPFAVFISAPQVNGGGTCGGAILTEDFIVTSATCITNTTSGAQSPASDIHLGYGSVRRGAQTLATVTSVFVPKTYSPSTFLDDIALLKVSPKLDFSDTVNRIALYIGNIQANDTYVTMGWGSTKNTDDSGASEQLIAANVTIGTDQRCQGLDAYQGSNGRLLCTDSQKSSGRTGCFGDGGNPLVVYTDEMVWRLVGISSTLYTDSGNYSSCTSNDALFYHTHVSQYMSFLTASTGYSASDLTDPGTSPGARSTSKLSKGAIAGIVVGGLVLLVLVVLLGVFVYRYRKQQEERRRNEHIYQMGLKQLAEELGGTYEPPRMSKEPSVLENPHKLSFSEGTLGGTTELTMDTLVKSKRQLDGQLPHVVESILPNREGKASDHYPLLQEFRQPSR
ncbi:trypsin-like serine protease [Martensiomyces pterosporus]|nr:trypsin-like serine protease [Martensiomyces pterosporus]